MGEGWTQELSVLDSQIYCEPKIKYFFPSDSMKKTKRQPQTGRWYSQHILTVNTLVPRFYTKFPNSKLALSHLSFAGHFPNNRLIPGISPQGNFHNSPPSNLIPLKIQVYLGHGYFFYLLATTNALSLKTSVLKFSFKQIYWPHFSDSSTSLETQVAHSNALNTGIPLYHSLAL